MVKPQIAPMPPTPFAATNIAQINVILGVSRNLFPNIILAKMAKMQ